MLNVGLVRSDGQICHHFLVEEHWTKGALSNSYLQTPTTSDFFELSKSKINVQS